MERNARWTLLGAVAFLLIGVYMLVKGIGPDWYSYVSAALVFAAAVAWTVRYVLDVRKERANPPAPDTIAEDH